MDVARFGDDATVFFPRQGSFAYEPTVLRKFSNVEVAHNLVAYINECKPKAVCIDQGQGTGVIDLVRELTRHHPDVSIVEIPFGSRAVKTEKFVNRRAEIWTAVRDWIRDGGKLPRSEQLLAELAAPTYSYDSQCRIKLEAKEEIKKRLEGKSTDLVDALALTFAVHLPSITSVEWEQAQQDRDRHPYFFPDGRMGVKRINSFWA